MSQAFLDEVRHQGLRSLLVLHQNVMRRGDLVALKAIQQCNADHSRWKGLKRKKNKKHDHPSLCKKASPCSLRRRVLGQT